MIPRIKCGRKRTVRKGEKLRLFNGENFDELAPRCLGVPFPESAKTNRRAALEYARDVCREIARGRNDHCCCADDLGLALSKMGREINLGKSAGGVFRNGEWEETGETVNSQRVTNNGRGIIVWRLIHWQQLELFEPRHFFLT